MFYEPSGAKRCGLGAPAPAGWPPPQKLARKRVLAIRIRPGWDRPSRSGSLTSEPNLINTRACRARVRSNLRATPAVSDSWIDLPKSRSGADPPCDTPNRNPWKYTSPAKFATPKASTLHVCLGVSGPKGVGPNPDGGQPRRPAPLGRPTLSGRAHYNLGRPCGITRPTCVFTHATVAAAGGPKPIGVLSDSDTCT